ncbi:oxidoreductase [Nocardia sp. NPDC020380]|uniref:oxidoreductase n=1 Tax=Nocardia sp. NPDC020380 TaxID=3364309 RepID=UPI0037A3F3FD
MTSGPLDREFGGLRVLVTGGTRGLGAAIAHRLESAGARVVVAARTPGTGTPAGHFIAADLTTADGPRELAAAALDHLGGVDILVDNAGAQTRVPGGILAMTDDEWLTDLSGSLLSAVRLDREIVPDMITRGRGVVIHVGSNAARWPQPAAVAYAAAKAALHTYSKGLAGQVAGQGIRVNVVSPGVIETSGLTRRLHELAERSGGDIDAARAEFAETFHIPTGRPGGASEVAELVAFLASDRAAYITGTVQVIDGGVLPTL